MWPYYQRRIPADPLKKSGSMHAQLAGIVFTIVRMIIIFSKCFSKGIVNTYIYRILQNQTQRIRLRCTNIFNKYPTKKTS